MKLTTEELFIQHAKANKPSLLTKSIICLHNIRSAYNVGAVFRNADAFGIKQVFLSGFTPTPETNIEVSKTAIGAEKKVPWSYFVHWSACKEKLQKSESQIFAVEQTKKSKPLNEFDFNEVAIPSMAFVFGNEVKGLDDEVLDLADHHLIIPQFGTKHSLNISVATGVVMYDLLCKSV